MRLRQTFGDRFLGFIVMNYVGMKGIAFTVVVDCILPFFQRMGVSSSDYQMAVVVAMIPWSMKGLVGVMSDTLPIGPYHKRGYLLVSSFFGLAGCWALGYSDLAVSNIWVAACFFCCVHITLSTFDLLCEGKYSELLREQHAGSEVLTLVWTCVSLGGACGSLAVFFFIDHFGPRPILAAVLPPMICLAAWRSWAGDLPEKKARSWTSLRYKACSEPKLLALAILMAVGGLTVALSASVLEAEQRLVVVMGVCAVLLAFSFKAMPRTMAKCNMYIFLSSVLYINVDGPLAYFFTGGPACVPDGPHFSYSYFLAVSDIVGSACAALGAVGFHWMRHWQFRHVFVVATLAQILAAMSDVVIINRLNLAIGISDVSAYLFGNAACQRMTQQLTMMPAGLLIARLCPREAEATVFAILAGFQNLGFCVSSVIGVQLAARFGVQASMQGPCEFSGLTPLVVLAHGIIPLLCLPLVWILIPAARINDEDAFNDMSPPPTFASPAPSPTPSPACSPRGGLNKFDASSSSEDQHGEYQLMVE